MNLFGNRYSKPGPGVSKDEPRKKGVRRFLEVFSRDFRDIVKLNLLFCVCAAPTVILFILGLLGFYSPVALVLSILAAFPVGGAITANMYCISKMLYDEPGFLWHDFKRKFLENIKQAAAPGMLSTAFVYSQIFLWTPLMIDETGMDTVWGVLGIALLLFFSMVSPYVFIQIAYVDLKMFPLIKNSILLAISNVPRSFMGFLTGGIVWFVFILFFPVSLVFSPLILLFGFTMSWLLCLMWIWPFFNKHFAVEETLTGRKAENDF